MKRLYFVAKSLDNVETMENSLVDEGVGSSDLHLLSNDHDGAERRHLHEVPSIIQSNLVNSSVNGFLIGLALSSVVMLLTYFYGWHTDATWVPFIFLAILILGFSCWEGGLWGIQHRKPEFSTFDDVLDSGSHVLLIDAEDADSDKIRSICLNNDGVVYAGSRL